MLKLFSMLVVAGVTTVAGADTARADSCGCAMGPMAAAPAPATARAPAARAPATAARPGTQTIRRYSAAPASTYRAPAMRSYRSNRSNGPSYSATRKVLGY